MKRLKLPAAGAAMLLLCSLTGCSEPLLSESSHGGIASDPRQYDYPRYDIDGLKARIEALQKQWSEPGKESEIASEIKAILTAEDEAYAISKRAEIAYFANWSDEALFEAHSATDEDFAVVDEMVTWCLANGARFSEYKDLFSPYVDESWMDYYIVNRLPRVMSAARFHASESNERLEEYYDTAYDSELSTEELNRICAGLYLEMLADYDLSDFLYTSYDRDYTAEQASEAAAAVLEEIVPVYEALRTQLVADPRYDDAVGNMEDLDAYALLKEYAPRISPYVAESVQKLFNEKLYTSVSGDDCYDGSYTVNLPNEQSAMMYTYLEGDYYDLITVTHEFGHFHSDWRDRTTIYEQINGIDIAESQSQGMEMMFTAYYGEIFGDQADYLEKLAVYNILGSIVDGFAVGEFEYRVMQNADRFSAEDVLNCYDELNEQYGIGLEFYEITHLFEQPGYYVSYGVSALSAIQIYTLLQKDPELASVTYDTLCSISSVSGEIKFMDAVQMCGLHDPFEPDTLAIIAETVSKRLDELDG